MATEPLAETDIPVQNSGSPGFEPISSTIGEPVAAVRK